MIKDPSKELTVIVYDSPTPPKYLKFNKKVFKFVFTIAPIILILFIISTVGYSAYMKHLLEISISSEPAIIRNLKNEKKILKEDIASAKNKIRILSHKIAKGSSKLDETLSIFKQPLGFENKSKDRQAKIENFTHQSKNKKLILKFDLQNNRPERGKLSGYIRIFQYSQNGVGFYPPLELETEIPLISYSKGESFTVSRFRPVIADFSVPPKSSKVWYKIYLFSRSGDLILSREIGPYSTN